MKKAKVVLLVLSILLCSNLLLAIIINVPDDQPTIQMGIDASADTDTVLVQPGIYIENINYNGQIITVASLFLTTQDTSYISQTIIDGNHIGSVVTFESGEDSTAVLFGLIIQNGFGWGGGIYCSQSNPSLENIIIRNNTGGFNTSGSGIYCIYSSPSLKNVIINNNSTVNIGGGISLCLNSNPRLENTTICNNSAGAYGGGICCISDSNPSLINCIHWNNIPQEIYCGLGTITAIYSDIQGGWEGEGNINVDPLFVDPENGDYHLTECSPCIDAGNPNSPFDPDGTIADMGAFYYDQLNEVNDNVIQIVEYDLYNFPNPFNPTTTISLTIQEESNIELSLYNIKGQKIRSLLNNQITAGEHSIVWNGEDDSGKKVGSGVYLYKLHVNDKIELVKKCLLLK
jgi:hypothetical protein